MDIIGTDNGEILNGGRDNDVISALGGDDTLNGGGGNDTLDGGDGNDLLDGGTGNDGMTGGAGDDVYFVDSTEDIVTELVSGGLDEVRTSVSYIMTGTHGENVETLTLLGAGDINGTGNGLANLLTGNSGNNILDGGLGVDTMIGGLGDDIYLVNTAGETVIEYADEGTDLIQSAISYDLRWLENVENLTLTGSAALDGTGNGGDNVLVGNGGKNTLDGGIGNDTMKGGGGNDTYFVDSAGDVVIEGASAGTDLVVSSVDYTLTADVENLTLAGLAVYGSGNALANILTGNDGTNILSGGAGNDKLYGADGDDALSGETGNDTLDGGYGADSMTGGEGNDTYWVDADGDVITEDASAGTDLVWSAISYTLTANVENLTLAGAADINATGNALANALTGNTGANILSGDAGNDTLKGGTGNASLFDGHDQLFGGDGDDILDGGTGNDIMTGGAGSDVYFVDSTGDQVFEEDLSADRSDEVRSTIGYMLAAHVENLTLIGVDAVNGIGNALDNVLTGNGNVNVLDGGDGDDTLNGGGGVDDLRGGIGNDTYVIDGSGDTIEEDVNHGIDLVQSSVSYTLGENLENLILTGSTNIDGTGNTLDNEISGNSGRNILDGGAGVDIMLGGDGHDVYYVDRSEDVVVEIFNFGSGGIDLVNSWQSYTLSANVEHLVLLGADNTNGTGNELNNQLTGNEGSNLFDGGAGNDILDGRGGADDLRGGTGNDTYFVENPGDQVTEAAGAGMDLVVSTIDHTLGANVENLTLQGAEAVQGTGNALNNVLTGNDGDNILNGLAGDDTLHGGAGNDSMNGGMGNDVYSVDAQGDTVKEVNGEGIDTVNSAVSYALSGEGAFVENLTLTGTLDIDGAGNDIDNNLAGNSGANHLVGFSGNDTLVGNAGNDELDGGAGNDVLDGGAGDDTMIGGLGNDVYHIDSTTDIVRELDEAGVDTVQSVATYALSGEGAFVENLTLTGTAAINGEGNALNNVLTGNSASNILYGYAGNDTLVGGKGGDVLIGGTGNDVYDVDNTGDVVREYVNEGIDTIISSVTYKLAGDAAHVEHLTLTGSASAFMYGNDFNNRLTGNSGRNTMYGYGGDDILDGGGSYDTMIGGKGNDVYFVNFTGDIVTELAGEGIDLVYSTVTETLDANVEKLVLTGTAVINGTGNTLNNTLVGNAAANILNGSAGADAMVGGLGNDTYYVDNTGDVTAETSALKTEIDTVYSSVSRALGNFLEKLILTGTSPINGAGNTLNNTLTGNTAANTLNGGAGNDTLAGNGGNDILNGGAGIDTMSGGTGNDVYYADSLADVIKETSSLTTEIDTVVSSVTQTLGSYLENLTLIGGTAINATGNTLNNRLVGNGAANTLSGGSGNDVLNGAAGNDVLIGGTGSDTLIGGAGKDVFLFDTALNALTNKDVLSGYAPVDDTIRLDRTIFSKLSLLGTLNSAFFRSNATGKALDSNDYILYNTTTGALSYDRDGSGTGVATQFATLAPKPALTAAEFVVVA